MGIILVLTILASCASSTPVTPRLPLATTPDYSVLSQDELYLLGECVDEVEICFIYRKTLNSLSRKDRLCRNYARELEAIILNNNSH